MPPSKRTSRSDFPPGSPRRVTVSYDPNALIDAGASGDSAPQPRTPKYVKSFNWEGIVVAIFTSVVVARMFVIAEQAADLHQRLDPLDEPFFDSVENQTVARHSFLLGLNKTTNGFESKLRTVARDELRELASKLESINSHTKRLAALMDDVKWDLYGMSYSSYPGNPTVHVQDLFRQFRMRQQMTSRQP